jgi:hypothetical protein
MVNAYVRVSKVKALKYAQKEFSVPIVVVGALMNKFTGQELALVHTKTSNVRWYIVWLGQDAVADYDVDEAGARKRFDALKR